jgi:N-acetylneuraminic acid mutarotase
MNKKKRSARYSISVVVPVMGMIFGGISVANGQTDLYAPQTQSSLRQMLSIVWKKGPDLPQGLQDSFVGIVDHTLVTSCGFCQGSAAWANAKELDAKKPGRYPRGFLNKTWGLDLENPAGGWTRLPDCPASGRQGGVGIVVSNTLYGWGGFNYTEPFCYGDGYRFSKSQDVWKWDALPPMPSPTGGSAICAIGSIIYVCGGADYDSERFYTATDRSKTEKRLGSRLLVIDTNDLAAGWKRLPECPGTPRWVAGMAAVGGQIYQIGGATGELPNVGYCTVVDNWRFDPASNQWSRLRDLPISSGNFFSGDVAFQNRYILLIAGAQYPKVANPDGTIRDKYGVPSQFQDKGSYFNDVFVYDVQSNLFGTADKLPLNNNATMTVVCGDKVYMLGGETGGAVVEGELFGHHPDLCLIGTIREKAE